MRLRLDLRYLRYRDVAERLRKLAGCEPVRQGAGSHERWKNRLGYRFTVPRHAGDLSPDTVRKIIQQAGLKMGLEEFATAEV
jgi:predicted RNA binding protein YcfA (HicA-like mRNA interferase family)